MNTIQKPTKKPSEAPRIRAEKIAAFKALTVDLAADFNAYAAIGKAFNEVPSGNQIATRFGTLSRQEFNSAKAAIGKRILGMSTKFTEGIRTKKISSLSQADLAIELTKYKETTIKSISDSFVRKGERSVGSYTAALYARYVDRTIRDLYAAHKDAPKTQSLNWISDQLTDYFAKANFGSGLVYLFPEMTDLNTARSSVGSYNALITLFNGVDNAIAYLRARAQKLGVQLPGSNAEISEELKRCENALNYFDLVTRRHLGSTTIVVSLFALVSNINGLRSQSENVRTHYNQNMMEHFGEGTNTAYVVGGRPIDNNPTGLSSDNAQTLAYRRQNANRSAFSLISGGVINKKATKTAPARQLPSFIPYENAGTSDNWGFHNTTVMSMLAMFTIPTYLQDPKDLPQAEYLAAKQDATCVQAVATLLKDRQNEIVTLNLSRVNPAVKPPSSLIDPNAPIKKERKRKTAMTA
jgi:hypothetical protein